MYAVRLLRVLLVVMAMVTASVGSGSRSDAESPPPPASQQLQQVGPQAAPEQPVDDRLIEAAIQDEDEFVGLTPFRLLDTRIGNGAPVGPLGPGQTIELKVVSRGGVPGTGVAAVVLNLTSTQASTPGYVTAWPTGETRPLASNLNVEPGTDTPNLTMIKVGKDGKVSLFNSHGTGHLVADVLGWFPAASTFEPLSPSRLLDTRIGNGAPKGLVGPGKTIDLTVVERGGVPAVGVGSVVLNVTSTEASTAGYVTAWPSGELRPLASNLNVEPGQDTPNLTVVKVGENGKVSLFNSHGTGHLVADVLGWFPIKSMYRPQVPERLLDTRIGTGGKTGALGPGDSITLDLPADHVGSVIVNVTSTQATAPSYITAWPAGEPRPLASNVNIDPGQDTPNLAVIKTGKNGDVELYNRAGDGHLVVDLLGWFPIDATLQSGAGEGATAWVIAPNTTKAPTPSQVLSLAPVGQDGAVIMLAAGAPKFSIGDHIALPISTATPHGLLGEVTGRTALADGRQRLEVAQAPMEEAFLGYELDYDSAADPSLPPVERSGFPEASGNIQIVDYTINASDLKGEDCQLDGDLEIMLDAGIGWTLSASFSWPLFKAPRAYVTALVRPHAETSISVQELSAACGVEFSLYDKDKLVWAGFIPIVVNFEVLLGIDLEAGMSLGTGFEASASASVEMGLERNRWVFRPETDFSHNAKDVLAGGVDVFAMVDVWLDARVGLYWIWVVRAGIGPFAEFRLSTQPTVPPTPWWTLDLGLAARLQLGDDWYALPLINHELPIFGSVRKCDALSTNTLCSTPAPAVRANGEPRTPCIGFTSPCTAPRLRLTSAKEAWPQPLKITTIALPDALVDQPYTIQLKSTGGWQPVSWTFLGTPPAGFTLTTGGSLTGTPGFPIVTDVGFQVKDRKGNATTRTMQLRVRTDNPSRLIPVESGYELVRSDVSNNGRWIVYSEYRNQHLFDRATSQQIAFDHVNEAATSPTVSDDGKFVVIGEGDYNGPIHLHDLDAGTVTDIFADIEFDNIECPDPTGDPFSACDNLEYPRDPVISGNGLYVVYKVNKYPSGAGILRYDRQSRLTSVVSVPAAGGVHPYPECGWEDGFASYDKMYPSISDDGTVISFAVECEGWYYAIVDLTAGTITQVLEQGDTSYDRRSVLSGDGRHLFFATDDTRELASFDRQSASITYYGYASGDWIAVDDDGDTIAFTSNAQLEPNGLDTDAIDDVYVVRDGVVHLASQPYGVGGDTGRSWDPAISGDGNTVTFTSDSRLVPDDDQLSDWDVYVHSLLDAF